MNCINYRNKTETNVAIILSIELERQKKLDIEELTKKYELNKYEQKFLARLKQHSANYVNKIN